MVKGHHLQLWCHPPLFHNFKWFNIKAARAYHPFIPKELVELLAKGAIEPLTGGAGFYWNVFLVPKCTQSLWSILSVKHFNCFMHVSSFMMPTIRQVLHLIQKWNFPFCVDLKDYYLYIGIVNDHHNFYGLWAVQIFSVEGFAIWTCYSP